MCLIEWKWEARKIVSCGTHQLFPFYFSRLSFPIFLKLNTFIFTLYFPSSYFSISHLFLPSYQMDPKFCNMETMSRLVTNKIQKNRYWGKAKTPIDHNAYHVSSPRPSVKWVQFHQQSTLLQEHTNLQPVQICKSKYWVYRPNITKQTKINH